MSKAVFNKKKAIFVSKLDLNLSHKLINVFIFSIDFYGAEYWTLWKKALKYLEICEMFCWRALGKISWND
jgi:hypothetical protein